MSTTKKILLILIPVVAVIVVVFILVISNLKNQMKEFDEKIEHRKQENVNLYDEKKQSVYGSGNVVRKVREIDEFEQIVLKGAFEVALIESDSTYIEVETDDNLHKSIMSEVSNNNLIIDMIHNIAQAEELKVYIGYEEISSIELKGAAVIVNKGVLRGNELRIDVKGAGSVDLEMDINHLDLNMAGGTHANLKGECHFSELNLSGVGMISAYRLVTDSTYVHVKGAGTVRVFADTYLNAKISGAGSIKYKGNPALEKRIAGFGKISKAN